jgi:ABC-type branched-subunit amino acid transport system permease subunit
MNAHSNSGDLAGARLRRWAWLALCVGLLCYLPVVLTERAAFGVALSNMQLLNLGLTQINLMLIAMLGALSLNYLTGCAGLISIGHAAFYATGAMTAAITGTQWGWPFPLVLMAAAAMGALAGLLATTACGGSAFWQDAKVAADSASAIRRRIQR